MDRIELTIDLDDQATYSMTVRADVNGEGMPHCIDPCAFLAATRHGGRLPVFTCECGEFGCGGYYLDVARTPDAWVLMNAYCPFDAPPFMAFEYRIDWSDVRRAVVTVRDAFAAVQARWPDAWVAVDHCALDYFADDLVFPRGETGNE